MTPYVQDPDFTLWHGDVREVLPTLAPESVDCALTAAAPDGLHADELGALLCEEKGRHGRDQRCVYDGQNGNQLLRALRAKGLARYRRSTPQTSGYCQALGVGERETPRPAGMLRDDEPLPY